MDQPLLDFVSNYHTLAKYRNISKDNPIKLEVQPLQGNSSKIFIVVVGYTEPTFSQIPYNVIWLPYDRNHPAYGKVLKRTSHADSGYYSNTWEEIEEYQMLWTPDQYYQSVVEDPRLHGITTSSEPLGAATVSEYGLAVLNKEETESRAVSIEDPRNSNPRYPVFHTHPDFPRTLLKIDGSNYARVDQSQPPQQGMLLFIVGQSSENPNEYVAVWKFPTQDDLNVVDESLIGISINGPAQVMEQTETAYTVTAYYANGVTKQVTPNNFSTSNNTASSINTDGNLVTNNIQDTTAIVLEASYTEDGITVDDTHSVSIQANLEVMGLEIVGDNSVPENTTFDYIVRATMSDNSTIDVTPDSITSSETSYAEIDNDAVLTAKEVDGGDKTTELEAVYTHDGKEVSATKTVTIEDTDPIIESLEIIGPTSLAENQTASYTFKIIYSDGSEVYPATPNTFTQSSTAYSSIDSNNYTLTAGSLSQDRTVRLTAEFSEYGNSVSGSLDIDLLNNPPVPVSGTILGANSIEEQTSSNYTLRVTFDDGSTQNYTADADWSLSGNGATISSSGSLNAQDIESDQTVTISSTINIQGTDISATKDVDITAQLVYPVSLEVSSNEGNEYTEGQTVDITYTVTYSDNSTASVKTSPDLTPSFVNNAYGSSFAGPNNNDVLLGDVTGNKSITLKGTYSEAGRTVTDNFVISVADSDVSPRWGVAPIQDFIADYADPAFYDLLTESNSLGGGNLSGTNGEEITVGPLNDNNTEQGFILYPKEWGYLYIVNTGNNFAGSWDMGRHTWQDGAFGSPAEITIGGTQYYVYRTDVAYGPTQTFSITYGSSDPGSGNA